MKYRPSIYSLSASLVVLLGAAGCASTEVGAQWTDPGFQGRSLRGNTLLVVCEARDAATKRVCQDQLAAQVTAYGGTPRVAGEIANPTPGREQNPTAYLAAARSAGAQAVLSAAVVNDPVATVGGGPSVGIGVGGWSGGRVGGGIGISFPFGGSGRDESGLGMNGALTDVASGKLMWSARASAPASADTGKQLDELARATLEAASKAGFF